MDEDTLMDHWRSPVAKGRPTFTPTHSGQALNAGCGDVLSLDFRMVDGRMVSAAFDGKGCVLSQAGGSLLVEWLNESQPTEEWLQAFRGLSLKAQQEFMTTFYGDAPIPVRWGCCLLPARALLDAKPVTVVE